MLDATGGANRAALAFRLSSSTESTTATGAAAAGAGTTFPAFAFPSAFTSPPCTAALPTASATVPTPPAPPPTFCFFAAGAAIGPNLASLSLFFSSSLIFTSVPNFSARFLRASISASKLVPGGMTGGSG